MALADMLKDKVHDFIASPAPPACGVKRLPAWLPLSRDTDPDPELPVDGACRDGNIVGRVAADATDWARGVGVVDPGVEREGSDQAGAGGRVCKVPELEAAFRVSVCSSRRADIDSHEASPTGREGRMGDKGMHRLYIGSLAQLGL